MGSVQSVLLITFLTIIKFVARSHHSAKNLIGPLVFVNSVILDMRFTMVNVLSPSWLNLLIEVARVLKMENVSNAR